MMKSGTCGVSEFIKFHESFYKIIIIKNLYSSYVQAIQFSIDYFAENLVFEYI